MCVCVKSHKHVCFSCWGNLVCGKNPLTTRAASDFFHPGFSRALLCFSPTRIKDLFTCPIFAGFTALRAAVRRCTVHRFVWELGRCHLFFLCVEIPSSPGPALQRSDSLLISSVWLCVVYTSLWVWACTGARSVITLVLLCRCIVDVYCVYKDGLCVCVDVLASGILFLLLF